MYTELYNFARTLFSNPNISICLHDSSGIYSHEALLVPVHARVHSTHFCSISKSTPVGFRFCYSCKRLSLNKCRNSPVPYWGYCPFGLLEYVCPVVVNETILAVLYIGNMTEDIKETKASIQRRATRSDIDPQLFHGDLAHLHVVSPEEKEEIERRAKIFADYMKLLYLHTAQNASQKAPRCWFVEKMIDYALTNYYKKITVDALAGLLHLNSKYAGRVFKEQVGVSFHQYITNLRLSAAREMLTESNQPISKISDLCGFDSASYFNRSFHKAYGVSPSQYRGVYAKGGAQT